MNFYDKSEAVERLRTGFQSVLTDVSEHRDHGVEAIQYSLHDRALVGAPPLPAPMEAETQGDGHGQGQDA